MPALRSRTSLVVGIATFAVLAFVGLVALVLTQSANGMADRDADQRARLGVDLLVTVGTRLPSLSSAHVGRGMSKADRDALDEAVASGQRQGLLAGLTIWDRTGRILYSHDERLEGTRPVMEAEVRDALAGRDVVVRHPSEIDASSGRHTGVLDALEPLRDANGRVYATLETSLPLRPIVNEAARIERRILLILIGGAAALWAALMPLTVRAARGVAVQWEPRRRRTLRAFRRALARGEIELVYQPQADPRDGVVHAVEALVRWRRGGRLEAPGGFLPIVEGSPLIGPLTERVFELALAQLSLWKAGGLRLRMSVNLSAANLADESLPGWIELAMARHRISASELTVEVTETAILEDPECAQRVVTAITNLGIEAAVDDFGTGHASISRLHQLPIAEVKIDRTFVMRTDEHSRGYLAAIVQFGKSLGLRVVAEGVEDAETVAFLSTLDCDLIQGFNLSRPLEPADLEAWLRARDVATATAATA
jgi:EAL domain-containing protein (putative c-di-GMP-specific phosphodiesterase class I)